MGPPSASIVVQGVLRPAFAEEHSFFKKCSSGHATNDYEVADLEKLQN